ncbi:MAG: hypothetical protein IT183_04570 [Acidobacteria bacterium]|nr:hypothetical protein [Acidobacteriota bacterium]
MNDEELTGTWTTLDPTTAQLRRIDARVSEWLKAHDTSLAAEWISLFRIAPFGALGLAAASVVAIVAVSPLLWFARAIAGVLM